MSWKLAELRWRQEAGLQENVGINRQQGKSLERCQWSPKCRDTDSIQMIEKSKFTPTAVWSQFSWEHPRQVRYDHDTTPVTSPSPRLTAQNVPDLDLSDATSPHMSVSSTTPLLKVPRTRSTVSFICPGPSQLAQLDGAESQLPIFPHHEGSCSHTSKAQTPLSAAIPAIVQVAHSTETSNYNSSGPEGPSSHLISLCLDLFSDTW